MNTIIINNIITDLSYLMPQNINCNFDVIPTKKKSCFYDFGAKSSLEFIGYDKESNNSKFVESIVSMF